MYVRSGIPTKRLKKNFKKEKRSLFANGPMEQRWAIFPSNFVPKPELSPTSSDLFAFSYVKAETVHNCQDFSERILVCVSAAACLCPYLGFDLFMQSSNGVKL